MKIEIELSKEEEIKLKALWNLFKNAPINIKDIIIFCINYTYKEYKK